MKSHNLKQKAPVYMSIKSQICGPWRDQVSITHARLGSPTHNLQIAFAFTKQWTQKDKAKAKKKKKLKEGANYIHWKKAKAKIFVIVKSKGIFGAMSF